MSVSSLSAVRRPCWSVLGALGRHATSTTAVPGLLTKVGVPGKGSSRPNPRFYSTSPPKPIMGMAPLGTDWASPSEDNIHVSDKPSGTFASYPLSEEILKSLKYMGCVAPFEIQEKTLPLTLNGRDVIGRAVTGSGKTLAFALPIVHVLSKSPAGRQPRALVITPTRELCNQVFTCIQSLSRDLRCVALYGGTPYVMQERELHRGVDVICATPGRLMDHLTKRHNFNLSNVQFLVLDEADELLTPQFKIQIEDVLEGCPKEKQMMLFSATMPPDIKTITREYMNNAEVVDLVTNRSLIPDSIVHQSVEVAPAHKMKVVADLVATHNPKRALIFMPSKVQTYSMAAKLGQLGFNAAALNSDMSQSSRDTVFRNFKAGAISILVATDVAARGLDVPDIELVIQFDVPPNGVDFYIHRSGRTGRKGQPGKTILVYSDDEVKVRKFMRELHYNKIRLTPIKPPTVDTITEITLKNAVAQMNPTTVPKEAMDLARPHAQELLDKFGVESLAAALVSISKVDSRLQLEEFGSGYGKMGRRTRWSGEGSRGGDDHWGARSPSRGGWREGPRRNYDDRGSGPRVGGASRRQPRYSGDRYGGVHGDRDGYSASSGRSQDGWPRSRASSWGDAPRRRGRPGRYEDEDSDGENLISLDAFEKGHKRNSNFDNDFDDDDMGGPPTPR